MCPLTIQWALKRFYWFCVNTAGQSVELGEWVENGSGWGPTTINIDMHNLDRGGNAIRAIYPSGGSAV